MFLKTEQKLTTHEENCELQPEQSNVLPVHPYLSQWLGFHLPCTGPHGYPHKLYINQIVQAWLISSMNIAPTRVKTNVMPRTKMGHNIGTYQRSHQPPVVSHSSTVMVAAAKTDIQTWTPAKRNKISSAQIGKIQIHFTSEGLAYFSSRLLLVLFSASFRSATPYLGIWKQNQNNKLGKNIDGTIIQTLNLLCRLQSDSVQRNQYRANAM